MDGSWGRRLCIACGVALLCTACSSPASTSVNQGAGAHAAKTLPLAAGGLLDVPTGNLFIRIIEFHQDPGTSFPSQVHVPGLIFQSEGSQVLAIHDGATVQIGPAQGFFLGPSAHTHSNPGPTGNHWYFLALWPTNARSSPLVFASARVAYATTPDFPLTTFAPIRYSETLRWVALEPGGRTSAAKYGGIETLLVLDGSISVHAAGKLPEPLSADQGTNVLPGTATQIFNQGSSRSTFLAFYITAADQPFETPLDQSP
jgi:hypothetical protein